MDQSPCTPQRAIAPLAAALVLTCLCPLAPADDGVEYRSDEYGYSLRVPAGWVRVPDEVLQATFEMVLKSETKIAYDMGFQADGDAEWLTYPYVLVQIIEYEAHGLRRQPREAELGEIVKVLTGMDVQESVDSELSDDFAGTVSDAELTQPVLDRENHRFHFKITSHVAGAGQVRAAVAGYVGHEAVIQVMYYNLADRWDPMNQARGSILESLQFDPDRAFQPYRGTALGVWLENPVVRGALIGAVAGAIGGTIVALLRRFRRRSRVD